MIAWPTKKLGEVAAIERSTIQPELIASGTAYLGLEHIQNGGAILSPKIIEAGELASSKFRFTSSHILYGKLRPYLAKIACPDIEGICSTDILPILPGAAVDRRFLCHFLRQPSLVDYANARAAGANLPRLSPSVLVEIPVPVPPLEEQERIAGILDKADGVRRKREEALKLSDELLRSVFLEMFGDPVTNPKGWPVKALKVLGRVTTGTTPPSAEEGMFDGNIPFITPGDLKETWVKTSRTVTEKGALKARTISKGATLVCCIGATIGKMGKAAQLSAFNQQINAIEWGEQVNADYGLETLKFFKKTIAQRGSSTTLPILNKSAFQQLEIPVASEVNQRQFSEVVEVIDRMRTNTTETLFQTQSLFSSLQQRAFSGQL